MNFLNGLEARININGKTRVDRLHKRKRDSFLLALENSDQSVIVEKEEYSLNEETNEFKLTTNEFRALMNPSKLTQDVDQKMFSIDFSNNAQIGDILHCPSNDSYWILLWRHFEEESYLRCESKRCSIEVVLPNGIILKGAKRSPVETVTPYTIKQKVEYSELNSTVYCIFPLIDDLELDFFNRGKIIQLEGNNYEVIARDILATGRTIEVNLKEYYNEEIQEVIEKQEVVEDVVDENKDDVVFITGDVEIRCYDRTNYSISNITGGTWSVNDTKKVSFVKKEDNSCRIEVLYGKAFNFELRYTKGMDVYIKKICVRSL